MSFLALMTHQVIDALTAQGMIVPETPSPTVMMPPGGRLH